MPYPWKSPWDFFGENARKQLKDQLKPVLLRYADHKKWGKFFIEQQSFYDWRDTTYDLVGLTYHSLQPSIGAHPTASDSLNYTNDSSVTDTQTRKISEVTTDSYTWTLKEGLKVGAKTSFSVKVPIIADGKVEVSTELNFESTQAKTITTQRTWELSLAINIPPMSTVRATWAVMQASYETPFDAVFRLSGTLYVMEGIPTRGTPYLINITDDSLFRSLLQKGTPEVCLSLPGTWKGVSGIELVVDKKAKKLEDLVKDYATKYRRAADQASGAWVASHDGSARVNRELPASRTKPDKRRRKVAA